MKTLTIFLSHRAEILKIEHYYKSVCPLKLRFFSKNLAFLQKTLLLSKYINWTVSSVG